MTIRVKANFVLATDAPATGLTLADIDLYLTRVHKTTLAETVIWDGTQNPTAEIDNVGAYHRAYTGEDLNTYDYDASAVYTGITSLKANTVQGGISNDIPGIWDRILTGATHNIANSAGRILRQVQEGGYQDSAIWIDTVNGTPGGDGTIVDPVDGITPALAKAVSLGFRRLEYFTGSSDTLVAAVDGYRIQGFGYSLALGGQSISGTKIHSASITGVCTAANPPEFRKCSFGNTTLPSCTIRAGSFGGTLTLSGAGNYFLDKCFSAVAGISAPIFDFLATTGSTNLNMRHYSGGVDLRNMGVAGTDRMSLEGYGQLILNANCVGGTIAIRGHFTVTNNSGSVALSDNARFDAVELVANIWGALTSTLTIVGSIGKFLVDNVHGAADVWSYVTRTLTTSTAQVVAGVSGSNIEVLRGDTWTISITGLGDISTARTKLWFSVKKTKRFTDAQATVQIEEGVGLAVLNGADASARAANGSLTVDDATLGNITIVLDEVETDDIEEIRNGYYDVQVLMGGNVTTLTSGEFDVPLDVTRSIT